MADENNQGAPANAANDAAASENASSAAGTTGAANNDGTANNAANEVPAFDPRTSYDSLTKEFQSVSKSYKELQREFTRRNQDSSELRKQLDTLHKAFTEATREEVTPEAFMKSLQSQGVKAFDPLREQWTKELKDDFGKQLSEQQEARLKDRNEFEVMKRELNTSKYPDVAKLKPLMNEIATSDNCPIDWNQDLGVIYDTLYKLAKDGSAENSVKEAREIGRKEAESRAANEANAGVAGGGKSAGSTTPDLNKITDIAKLREMVAQMHGVADR